LALLLLHQPTFPSLLAGSSVLQYFDLASGLIRPKEFAKNASNKCPLSQAANAGMDKAGQNT